MRFCALTLVAWLACTPPKPQTPTSRATTNVSDPAKETARAVRFVVKLYPSSATTNAKPCPLVCVIDSAQRRIFSCSASRAVLSCKTISGLPLRARATGAWSRRVATGGRTWPGSSGSSNPWRRAPAHPAPPGARQARGDGPPAAHPGLLLPAARGRRGPSRAELHAPPARARLALHGGVRGGGGLLGDRPDARARGPSRDRSDPGARRERALGLAHAPRRSGQ